MDNRIMTINQAQRDDYERVDLKNSRLILQRYRKLLDLNIFPHQITILDVGGGGGYFTKAVCGFLEDNGFEVKAYVLDTMRYPSWDDSASELIFCEGSVENVDTCFKEQKFDLIFCNKVFHHFVTSTYSKTLRMLQMCMTKLKMQLSEHGRLCILDYFYDGIIIDGFPSWMIYQCTSQKNELLIRLFKKMGAKSSGTGVCFQSEKMWRKLIEDCGLDIKVFERGSVFPMKVVKQILFLSHKPVEDCIFVCTNLRQ